MVRIAVALVFIALAGPTRAAKPARVAGPTQVGCVDRATPMVPAALFEGSLDAPRKPTPAEANLILTGMAAAKEDTNAGDWAGLCRYRAADWMIKAAGRLPRAVFMGDSITDDWDDANPKLFAGEQVVDGLVDRGIGGQTTQQMLLRFSQDVLALR